MVSKSAVFASLEVKTDTGRLSKHQQTWLNAVRRASGIADVAKVGSALRILD